MSIFSFSQMFSTLSRTHFVIKATANLLFANALTLSQTTNFGLFQTQRVCRRQFQI